MKQQTKYSQKEWEDRIEAKKGRKVMPLCPMCAGSLEPLVMQHEVREVVQVPVMHEGKKGLMAAEFAVLVCQDCGTMQRVHVAACTVESRIQVAGVVPKLAH